MRTLILGAGASHSYSQSPSGIRPPLARNFFEAFNVLSISGDRHVLIGSILNYVRDTRGVNILDFPSCNENIEDFLTEIDEQLAVKENVDTLPLEKLYLYSDAYSKMLFLFASVLNEIQNGPTCESYANLVRGLRPGDSIITFNWDTLLD